LHLVRRYEKLKEARREQAMTRHGPGKTRMEGKPMKWTVRSVYFYLVSFVMLITLVFGMVTFINNIVEMFDPSRMSYYDKPAMETSIRARLRTEFPNATDAEIIQWAKDEVEANYANQVKQDLYYRWRSLIQSAVLILIAGPTYRYHWRKAQALDT
jgi:hypothetical protein